MAEIRNFSILITTAVWLCGGCLAVPTSVERIHSERQSDGSLLLTIHVDDVDGMVLARQIGDLAGIRVLADPVQNQVTVCVNKLPWRSALDAVAREMFCKIYDLTPDCLRIVKPACNPPLALENAEIDLVLQLLAKQLGRKLVLPSQISGNVTGCYSINSLQDVRVALDTICETHGLRVAWPDHCSDSPIIVMAR